MTAGRLVGPLHHHVAKNLAIAAYFSRGAFASDTTNGCHIAAEIALLARECPASCNPLRRIGLVKPGGLCQLNFQRRLYNGKESSGEVCHAR